MSDQSRPNNRAYAEALSKELSDAVELYRPLLANPRKRKSVPPAIQMALAEPEQEPDGSESAILLDEMFES